jgi:hypothetical protein
MLNKKIKHRSTDICGIKVVKNYHLRIGKLIFLGGDIRILL